MSSASRLRPCSRTSRAKAQGSLLRMFADPHLLEKAERAELVQDLRECVAANPEVSELRVLLGMALLRQF